MNILYKETNMSFYGSCFSLYFKEGVFDDSRYVAR